MNDAARSLDALFEQRRRRMLHWGAGLSLMLAVAVALGLLRQGPGLALLGALASGLCALAVLALLRWQRVRAASWVAVLGLGLSVALMGLLADVPVDASIGATPRSVHLYLLPLTLLAYLLLSREARALRLGLCGALLALLCVLALWPNPLGIHPPLGEAERRALAPVAPLFSALMLALLMRLRSAELNDQAGIELELARAIVEDGLEVHFQPQCDAEGRALGVEALVRWRHPRLGAISPASFVPLAERNGLIVPLGEQVLRKSCAYASSWQGQPGMAHLQVAVNVSAIQMADEAAFQRLLDIVQQQHLPVDSTKFELTESVFAEHAERVKALLERCHADGVATSLDDFGTGYSSLAYLSRLPFDQLKIDQSFVRALAENERSRQVARTVLQLGQQLGMEVIAEGVETREQLALLLDMGCTRFQGYLFSKPLTAAACTEWLQAHPMPQAA